MRIFYALIFITLFTGCGIFRRTSVDVDKLKSKEVTASTSSVDSNVRTIDKTVIREKETADTTVRSLGGKVNTTKPGTIADLSKGLMLVDTGLVTVQVKFDSLSKTFQTQVIVKPQDVPVKFTRERTTYKDVVTDQRKQATVTTKKEAVIEQKTKKKVREPVKVGWLLILGISAAVIFLILFLVRRFFPSNVG